MQDEAGVLDVAGAAEFRGASTNGLLTAGELRVGGNFLQSPLSGTSTEIGSRAGFAASGSYRVVLQGPGGQVNFTNAGDSHFRELQVAPGAAVNIGKAVVVSGSLDLAGR